MSEYGGVLFITSDLKTISGKLKNSMDYCLKKLLFRLKNKGNSNCKNYPFNLKP